MAYTRQDFADGNVLGAEQLNAMDNQIAKNATDIESLDAALKNANGGSPVLLIENTDSENKTPIRTLESGTYILKGYFTAFEGSTASYTFSTGMLVAVLKQSDMTYVQIFYPKNNTIQYLEISDTDVTRTDAKFENMELKTNLVTEINGDSDNEHYPTAKAVRDYVESALAAIQGT